MEKIQDMIFQNKLEKGFNTSNVELEFCLLQAEITEAFEAYRKNMPNLGEELADIAIYLYGLSEILGFDLDYEIRQKVEINKNRIYHKENGLNVKK